MGGHKNTNLPYNQHLIILILLCLASFLLHISPIFFIDLTQYNYYDVDTWHFIRDAKLYTQGYEITGDDILISKIGSAISFGQTDVKQIFFILGFFNPILLVAMSFVIFFWLRYLIDERTAFYSAIIWLFPPDIYLNFQASYGVFDHHLLESSLFVILLLCSFCIIKKSRLFIPILIISVCAIIENSFTLSMVVIGSASLTSIIYGFYKINNKKAYLGLISAIILVLLVYAFAFRVNFIDIISWSIDVPISEMQPANIFWFTCAFGILLSIITIGLFKENLIPEIKTLFVVSVIYGIGCFVFMRMEYLFFPTIMIISGYFLKGTLSKFIVIYLMIAIAMSGICSYLIVENSRIYSGLSNSTEILKHHQDGSVLSVWDNENFINATSDKPMAIPGWGYVKEDSELLVSCNTTITDLHTENISYVLVSKYDSIKYQFLKGDMSGEFNCSFLNRSMYNDYGFETLYSDGEFYLYSVR